MRTKTGVAALISLAALSLVVACGGNGGGGGGGDTTGAPSVMTKVYSAVSTSMCPSGGIQVDAGIDDNKNGILDASEVDSTQYVCNGTDGTHGTNALVSVTAEAPGAHCATGGSKVSVGPDSNGNAVLDDAEITSSNYICHGTDGTGGTNGLNTLIATVSEPAGANCTYGGLKVTSGLDASGNSILDADEVTTTTYVCNGAPGPAGPDVTWEHVTGTSVQAASNTGYLADNPAQVTVTLPSAPVLGDIVQVTGLGPGGWKIAQNAGQTVITRNLPMVWTARESNRNWKSVASSADGTKLVATVEYGQIYTSLDSGVTWTARESARGWYDVASSADGTKLVAVEEGGQIYTSIDSGFTWTPRDAVRPWRGVATSTDGNKLVAVAYGGGLYTSTDSGETWTARTYMHYYTSVASSADGTKLVAVARGDRIYTSTDSGETWTARETARDWIGVASSADGTKLVAVVTNGQIYTSTDSGTTWIAHESARYWQDVTSSADGTKLAAVVWGGQIYTSTDSGGTWIANDSGRNWLGITWAADGNKLVAATFGGQVFTTNTHQTTTGMAGSISGGEYDAIELQYIGNNTFTVLSHEGLLTVQ